MEEKIKNSELALNCMAIGSLPHKNVEIAMEIVKSNFPEIPFWPQLAKFNKNEDMIIQFLEKMPGITFTDTNLYLDSEADDFYEKLEELFLDYEEAINDSSVLDKYKISRDNSSTIPIFLDIIKETKPKFAKGQIVGPFTLATTITDKEGRCAYYDETLREVIIKTLSLKALWQISKIKSANPQTKPIIFIDEPSISQLGTSAYITIKRDDVVGILKDLSDLIKANGALSAIHCCGKCDWAIPVEAGVDIINLDGYFFAKNLSLFHKQVESFIKNGGIIAWGVVPTLDKEALYTSDLERLGKKFEEALEYLAQKGLDKALLLRHSMITPSCGAGSLSEEEAQRAMELTKELSQKIKMRYSI